MIKMPGGFRAIFLIMTGLLAFCLPLLAADKKAPEKKQWPEILVVDDFSGGTSRWENQDTGKLTVSEDPETGKKALLWTSTDDSTGEIVFKNLKREEIDFSQYDLLVFRAKIAGRPVWNVGLILQQYPAIYGFRGMFYSIDTLHPFNKWFTFTQDLKRWENVWCDLKPVPQEIASRPGASPSVWMDYFDPVKQELRFEIQQLAGAGQTKVYLSDIRLMKNPLRLPPSCTGEFAIESDGTQITRFPVQLKNQKDTPLTVLLQPDREDPDALQRFQLTLPKEEIVLQPGEEKIVQVALSATPKALEGAGSWYGESVQVIATVKELPELRLFTRLTAGTRPAKVEHPLLICNRERMLQLQREYADESTRAKMPKTLLALVANGEKALAVKAEYPPLALTGTNTDPVSGGKLCKIDVPNLPFAVYQDPVSGRSYSGPLYDAGVNNWLGSHMRNAQNASSLAAAYLVSGRREFAEAAADIFRAYIKVYPELPLGGFRPGSPVRSACAGSTRIGGTFMRERVWLTDLACALDGVIAANVLKEDEIKSIADKIFIPSAMNMMDHEIGAMNLQMMIDSASLYAGLAAEQPDIVARAVYGTHGINRVVETGYLADGNWWENPSYQNVMNLCAYPVLVVGIRNGIFRWDENWKKRILAAYQIIGPDSFTPELGTGGGRGTSLEDTLCHLIAPLVDDPKIAWIAYNRPVNMASGELSLFAYFAAGEPKIAKEQAINPLPTSTTQLPDYGGIALRVPGSDAYAYLHYGREVTHGHRNKLSVHAYGKGGWYMRNIMGGYGDSFKDFLETIASAGTVMVDGKNANSDTGELLCYKSQPGVEIASAREIGAWTDVEHERTVVLTTGPMIIVDRLMSDQEHTYDWLYYAEKYCYLTLKQPAKLLPAPEKFGATTPFTVLKPVGQLAKADFIEWRRENGSGMEMALLPEGDVFLSRVEGKETGKFKGFGDNRGLLWRQKGKVCFFASVMLPLGKDEAGALSIRRLDSGGNPNLIEVEVQAPGAIYKISINYGAKEKERVNVTVTSTKA